MCDEWRNSFPKFLEDMGPCPENCFLERIDNNGPYSKSNCKWATRTEQNNNKRNNRFWTYDGVTKTEAQWIRHNNLKWGNFTAKYANGWTVAEILGYATRDDDSSYKTSGPKARKYLKKISHNGLELTYDEWSDKTGLPARQIYRRIHINKMTPAQALGYEPLPSYLALETITYNGIAMTIAEWSEARSAEGKELTKSTIRARRRLAWPPGEILEYEEHTRKACVPVNKFGSTFTVNGITKSWEEWSKPLGIIPKALKKRIKDGWDPEVAVTLAKNPLQKNSLTANR
jgi:hypothetical protein